MRRDPFAPEVFALILGSASLAVGISLFACEPERLSTVEVTAYAMPIQCYSDALEAPQETLRGYVTSTLAPNLALPGFTEFSDHGGTYVRARDGRRCVLGQAPGGDR